MSLFTLSREQVRELDRRAAEEFGVPGIVLMENAGRGCAELLMRLNPTKKPVVLVCGPGNNGGDGFVIARHLDNHGWPVEVWLFAYGMNLPRDAKTNYLAAKATSFGNFAWQLATSKLPGDEIRVALRTGIHIREIFNAGLEQPTLAAAVSDWHGKWVVDALFGTGLNRTIAPPDDSIIAAVNASKTSVFAVDLPSGLDCDTGEPLGPTVRATHTATFVAPKKGFLNPKSKEWTGEVHVIDIGAPRALVEQYHPDS